MKKKFLSLMMIMVMAFGVFALTGCGGSDDSAESDTLVVGLDDTFAPMGFRDEEGNLVGFDIDLANAVGEELGMTVEFKPICRVKEVPTWQGRYSSSTTILILRN